MLAKKNPESQKAYIWTEPTWAKSYAWKKPT